MKPSNLSIIVKSIVLSSSVLSAQALNAQVLEEVIVTAQKRSESLQDVPIAVSVASAEKLEVAGVKNFIQLGQIFPSVSIANNGSLLTPFIRGVGSFNVNAASYSSVAIYLDGLYMPRSNSLAFELDNIKQIEILKGPQSTIYGRNATGGAITLTTATPTADEPLNGKVSASVGNYSLVRLNGFISGGITDTFAANLAASGVERDGYYDNFTPGVEYFPGTQFEQTIGDEVSELDEYMVATKLSWTPSDTMQFLFSASYREADDNAFTDRSLNAVNFANAQLAGFGDAYADGVPTGDHEVNRHWGLRQAEDTVLNLTANVEFDKVDLVSITGWVNNKFVSDTEVTGLPVPLLGFGVDWNTDRFSQELRLHSNLDGPVSWMLGGEYSEEGDDDMKVYNMLALVTCGVPSGCAINTANTDWETTSYALFGEITWDFADNWRLIVGGRQTEEEFEATDLRPNPLEVDDEETSEFTYRLVLDWSFDWGMVYASRSTGYVSGGINVQSLGGKFVEPETLLSHEIGFKSELAGGRVRLNGAFFDYQYEDIHAQTIDLTVGATNLVSGDEATIRGVDFDIDAMLTENLSLTGGIAYLFDHQYDEFYVPPESNSVGNFGAIDATGNDIAGAPETVVVVGLNYDVDVGSGRLATNLHYYYNSGYFFETQESVGTGGAFDNDSYSLVNLRVEYFGRDDRWSVAAWANNLTDEHYFSGGYNAANVGTDGKASEDDNLQGTEALPATYGITATLNF